MNDKPRNIFTKSQNETLALKIILGFTFIFLITGLIAPIITVKKFILIENTFSVLSGTIQLLTEGQFFLFIIITGFSVILPLLKIVILYKLVNIKETNSEKLKRYLHWMHLYGKWSMLDVFVVAILVVAVKLGAIASVEIHYGLYLFAAAIILTMYVTVRVVNLTKED